MLRYFNTSAYILLTGNLKNFLITDTYFDLKYFKLLSDKNIFCWLRTSGMQIRINFLDFTLGKYVEITTDFNFK